MWFQDSQGDKQNEIIAIIIRPQDFPKTEYVFKGKFPFECNENPAARHGLESIIINYKHTENKRTDWDRLFSLRATYESVDSFHKNEANQSACTIRGP